MKKLADKYILLHFTTKSLMTMIVFLIIFLLVDIVENLDHIIDSNIPQSTIYKYYLYALPWYFSLSLPMTLLLGTIFTNTTLQKNNELTALKSAGVSIRRICTPLICLGIIISILSFYHDNTLVTTFQQKRNEIGIKHNLIRANKNKMKHKNIYRHESANTILGINKFNFRKKAAYDVSIQQFNDGELTSRLDSKKMEWNETENNWKINNFQIRNWDKNLLTFTQSKTDTNINLNFTPMDLMQTHIKPEEMNYWELKNFVNKLKKFSIQDPKWAVNMNFKAAFAFSSFLMILFGISLSIRKPRTNIAIGIGMSIITIFIYYSAMTIGRSLGFKGILSPFLSVWIPNILFLVTGLYLFYKVKS